MAAPRDRLGAHDGDHRTLALFEQPVERPHEGRRRHVVGVPAELRVAKPLVARVAGGPPAAAQFDGVLVGDAFLLQGAGEGLLVELRLPA